MRFSLRDLVYFQKVDKMVKVDLRHQHRDGHVSPSLSGWRSNIFMLQPAHISDREISSYFQVYVQDPSKM